MLIKLFGAAVQGIDATIVTIEVNSSRGIKFFLVGLPDSAVKESHERIVAALQVNGYKFPTCQIVINMAPADIRKEGSAYDLPLAIGILAVSGAVSTEKLERYLLNGELSLDGSLQQRSIAYRHLRPPAGIRRIHPAQTERTRSRRSQQPERIWRREHHRSHRLLQRQTRTRTPRRQYT